MMKCMYGIITMIAVFTMTSSMAQEKRDTVHYQGTTLKEKIKMKNELGLTKKQAKTIKASNQDFKEQVQSVKADTSMSQQEKRQQLKKIGEARQQKMDSLLTPEQREKAKELRKKKRSKEQAE